MRMVFQWLMLLPAAASCAIAVSNETGARVMMQGFVNVDFMQIVHSTDQRIEALYDSSWLDGYWLQAIDGAVEFEAMAFGRVKTRLDLSGSMRFALPAASMYNRRRLGYLQATQLYGAVPIGDTARPAVELSVGIFQVDYADKKIFGHYLINSGTYPGFVLSGSYEPPVRGVRARFALPAPLAHDVMVLSEARYMPYDDISLAYITRFSPAHSYEIGAGVMFDRLVPVTDTLVRYSRAVSLADSLRKGYLNDDGTMTWYSLQGVKIMARAAVDIKKAAGIQGRLGEEDLKLYAEAAILGVKNYKGWYEKIYERIPVMLGFHVPAFRLLDLAAIEVEYYRSPYWNNPPSTSNLTPVPNRNPKFITGDKIDFVIEDPRKMPNDKMTKDDFKWAVIARKDFTPNISMSVLAASDHFRDGGYVMDPYERLHAPDEWYWKASLTVRF